MSTYDYIGDNEDVTDKTSDENLKNVLRNFGMDKIENADEIIKESNDNENLSASEILDIVQGSNVKFRQPSIMTTVRQRTKGIFVKPQKNKSNLFHSRPQKNPYQKFKYYKDENGRVIRKSINPSWLSFEGNYKSSDFDKAGRMRPSELSGKRRNRLPSNTKFQKGGTTLLRTILPLDEDERELQQLQLKKYKAMQKRNVAVASMNNIANKFTERLLSERKISEDISRRRAYNTQPPNFVKDRLSIRQKQIRDAHQHSVDNSLLKAHLGNLTEKENAINFLSTENSILDIKSNSNNIMLTRPDSLRLLSSSGRPNILQTKQANNDLQF